LNACFFEGISCVRNVPLVGTIVNQPAKSPLVLVQNQSSEGERWRGGPDGEEWMEERRKNHKNWCLRVQSMFTY